MSLLNQLSASAARKLIDAGDISAEELVRACLARIREREDTIGAWEHIDEKQAIMAARRCDEQKAGGPLRGIPVGVKDNFDTFDMPTRYGSAIYRNHQPAWDAASVATLRDAGSIILGKTVTSEFAAYAWGKTRNPHDETRSAGISSMGSAAAVADTMVPVSIGSQTSGSTIRPAAYCGAVGFKPTFGTLNRSGLRPLAESLDTVGIFARCIEDAALLYGILGSRQNLSIRGLDSAPRIGVFRPPGWDTVSPQAASAFSKTLDLLGEAGAELVEIEIPEAFADLEAAQSLVLQYEAARAFAYEYAVHREQLSPKFTELLRGGQKITYEAYMSAKRVAATARHRFERLLSPVDSLLTLSAECEARPADDPIGNPTFNRFWTILGFPCISVPFRQTGANLPIGILLVAEADGDERLLNYAHWVEAALAAREPGQ